MCSAVSQLAADDFELTVGMLAKYEIMIHM